MPIANALKEVFENLTEVSSTKIWLVQKCKLVQQSRGKIASFFRGSSHIIIKTTKPEGRLKRDVYVWFGGEVEQREQHRILKSTYEAAKSLEGVTVYRQCEGNETRQFLDIFTCGVRFLNGTLTSFKHFNDGDFVKRLFRVKGKRNVHVTEVPLSCNSMSQGDSFVLEDEWTLYCWNGKDSNKSERIKTIEVARAVRDELCFGKAEIVVIDEGVDGREERRFFDALGSRDHIQSAEQGGDGDSEEKNMEIKMSIQQATRKLYRVVDDEVFMVDPMTYSRLNKYQLDSRALYLMDTGEGGLYAWIGIRYIHENIVESIMRFIDRDEARIDASVVIMREGLEVASFKQFFDEWPERKHTHNVLNEIEQKNGENDKENGEENDKQMIDDAHGQIRIWQIDGFNKLLWPSTWYRYFFDNECYIIEYYSLDTEQTVLYVWQGKESYEEEQIAAMELSQHIDKQLNFQATLIRVTQGKETEHFLSLFKGQMVVLMGKEGRKDRPKLFDVKGTNKNNMNATEVPCTSSLLHSDQIFLLQFREKSYMWQGKNITERMRDLSEEVADRMNPKGDFFIFTESQEIPAFWYALGGKKEYNDMNEKQEAMYEQARLFRCSDVTGQMKVEEIHPFDQKDLHSDDVIILDTTSEVFIWLGCGANENEKRTGYIMAQDFIKISGCDPLQTTINIEKQGSETLGFISHFKQWNYDYAMYRISYAELKKQVQEENIKAKCTHKCHHVCHHVCYHVSKHKKTQNFGQRILKRTQYKGILKK